MFKKQIHRLLGPDGPIEMVRVHQLISGEETEAEMGNSSPRSCGLGELSSLLSSSPPWLFTPHFHREGKKASLKGTPFSCLKMGA